MIKLIEITQDNYSQAFELEVHEGQKDFVAPNVKSIAQAYFYENAYFKGISLDEKMIGFVLLFKIPEDKMINIVRFMIDKEYQGKGYGTKAMQVVLSHIQEQDNIFAVSLSVVPENKAARALYEKMGFVDTGKIRDGEIVYHLDL